MNRHVLLRSFLSLVLWAKLLNAIELTNQDGSIRFLLDTELDGQLAYSIDFKGKPCLLKAPLGVVVNGVDLGVNVKIEEAKSTRLHEVFPWLGQKRFATNDCIVYTVTLSAIAGKKWTFEARLFRDGVGFRYIVPTDRICRFDGEKTAWRLPSQATVWFQTNVINYEGVYQSAPAEALPVSTKNNPVYFGPPITIIYPEGTIVLISEAALQAYSGLSLEPVGNQVLKASFPHDPAGWEITGTLVSPWRVAIITESLDALVNSDIIPSLCHPPSTNLFPRGVCTEWIRPGRGLCTWMVFGNEGAQWELQKWWVDMSAALGCEYLLVDAGWRSERWGWLKGGKNVWERLYELCRYAEARGVGILLWHAYPDGRDDSPGLTTPQAREEFFRHCAQAGVKGVKIDFFDSESLSTIETIQELRKLAAEYKLLIIFHGVNKPTGESRTWPNEITREGIREQEYQLWSAMPLQHYGALPFTRFIVGPADFLPGFIQPRFLKNTSAAFQIAGVVVFSSPVMFWPDHPEAYLRSPAYPFFRHIPTTWDETRVLNGSAIGKLVLMARRKADQWYVAVLNCERREVDIELDIGSYLLPQQSFMLFEDTHAPGGLIVKTGASSSLPKRLTLSLNAGGGFLLWLYPAERWGSW